MGETPLAVIYADVVREPLDPGEILRRVGHPEDGAVLLFLGVVRNHHEGRSVEAMRYDAYEDMARDVLASVAAEAAERLGTRRLAVVHRIGELAVGEPSVAIAVSSPHRSEAYEASRYVIEEIKKRLPVWKKERYTEGGEAWVEGSVPPVKAGKAGGS